MELEEIRLRRLANHGLISPLERLEAARRLCGIQAQFMSYAQHALRVRCSDWERGGEGLVKNWTLRGTLHVFTESDLPLFIRAENYRKNEWSGQSFWNSRPDWALTPERQSRFTEVVLEALAGGPKTRDELKSACRAEGMTEAETGSMFHPWGGGVRQLCERGFINYDAGEKKEFCLAPAFEPLPESEAKLELAKRYFEFYGPATVKDAAYFFGTSQAEVKKLLSQLPVTAQGLGGRTYFRIGGEEPERDIPRCIFLAGFDQLMLGYEKRESLFLRPEHLRGIFNLAGIVLPIVAAFSLFIMSFTNSTVMFDTALRFGRTRRQSLALVVALLALEGAFVMGLAGLLALAERFLLPGLWAKLAGFEGWKLGLNMPLPEGSQPAQAALLQIEDFVLAWWWYPLLWAAALAAETPGLAAYLPVLLVAGAITGFVNGALALAVRKRFP